MSLLNAANDNKIRQYYIDISRSLGCCPALHKPTRVVNEAVSCIDRIYQGCGIARSRMFLGEGGVGFLRTPGVGVRFIYPTPQVQLNHFLHRTRKLGIPKW